MVQVAHDGNVTRLTIESGRANALDLETLQELSETFAAHQDSTIVLTGLGTSFSAGVDLHRILTGGQAYTEQFLFELSRCFRTVFDHPRPVVAAINGHAIAGGCVLAAACDARLMSAGRIGLAELAVGVPFPIAALEICRSAFGAAVNRATSLSELHSPAAALRLGLIDFVVEPDGLLVEATALARRLADFAPEPYALTKRQVHDPAVRAIEAAAEYEAQVVRGWLSDDVVSRIHAQVETMTARRG